MLRLVDATTAQSLIDRRVPARRDGETTVYATHNGGRLYYDETGYLYEDHPRPVAVDATLEVPF